MVDPSQLPTLRRRPDGARTAPGRRGVQLGLGDFAEAERLCREALRLEPDSREAVVGGCVGNGGEDKGDGGEKWLSVFFGQSEGSLEV